MGFSRQLISEKCLKGFGAYSQMDESVIVPSGDWTRKRVYLLCSWLLRYRTGMFS